MSYQKTQQPNQYPDPQPQYTGQAPTVRQQPAPQYQQPAPQYQQPAPQYQRPNYMENAIEFMGIKLGIRVYPVRNTSSTLAMVNLNINGMFVIDTIRIVQGRQGQWFLSFPQIKKMDGTYKDIAFPIMGDVRKAVEDTACQLLDQYYNSAGH